MDVTLLALLKDYTYTTDFITPKPTAKVTICLPILSQPTAPLDFVHADTILEASCSHSL